MTTGRRGQLGGLYLKEARAHCAGCPGTSSAAVGSGLWIVGTSLVYRETVQIPFDPCDRLLRMADAFPPIASPGDDGPSTRPSRSRPQLGPFSCRTFGI
jgi:hypothetical protein